MPFHLNVIHHLYYIMTKPDDNMANILLNYFLLIALLVAVSHGKHNWVKIA